MVGYALELECDVMIAAFDSVSQSPGFESCLGIFGGEQKFIKFLVVTSSKLNEKYAILE